MSKAFTLSDWLDHYLFQLGKALQEKDFYSAAFFAKKVHFIRQRQEAFIHQEVNNGSL